MQSYKTPFLFALLLTIFFLTYPPFSAAAARQQIGAVTDGHGRVDLVWLFNPGFWPEGGWRLEEIREKKILVPAIRPGMAAVDDLAGTETKELVRQVQAITSLPARRERIKAGIFLLMENVHDFARLKTMGIAWTLTGVKPATHRYRVSALDRSGKKSGPVLETGPIDTSRATPPPRPPEKLSAETGKKGVLLHWQSSEHDSLLAAWRFRVERTDEDGKTIILPAKSFLSSKERKSGKLSYQDSQPPPEQQLSYRIIGRDIFGRKTAAATVAIFHPDPQALASPAGLTAKTVKNGIRLTWQPRQNPFTRGYLIERSLNIERGFKLLTKKPLDPATSEYTDRDRLIPGLTCFYRIRSVNTRGRVGKAGLYVSVTPKSLGPPRAPQKVKAEVRPARVRLSWQAPKRPVAGYLIEKRAEGKEEWQVLNGVAETRTLFNDPTGPEEYGTFSYRVIAVGYDNKRSAPSREITVQLAGRAPVPAPHLRDIRWQEDGVQLRFSRAEPKERVHGLLVIRGIGRQDQKGIILGKPVTADKTEFVDTLVRPGHDYWYALIGVDKDGRRSPLSNKLYVRTGTGKIPTPDSPKLSFGKKPFPHVVVRFARPPEPLLASVMRRAGDKGSWLTIADNIGGSERIIDADPPRSGQVSYRIIYTTENGTTGLPSDEKRLILDEEI